MPPVLFTNAALLFGLFALAIPVLLHLLMRRKKQRMRFSTLQFFLKQDEKSGQRHKLHQWLLLAARLLLVALIVLAFARPYRESAAPAGGAQERRNIVFVLDRSASMQAADDGVSRWTKAKGIIAKALDGLTWNDRVALVECATPSSTLFPFMPPAKLKPELERLAGGYGGGELSEALQEATKLLSSKDLTGKPGLCVVSDLQRRSLGKIAGVSVPGQIELKVFPVGNADLPNRAVWDLNFSPDGGSALDAEVADFSTQDQPNGTKLDWVIDGTETRSSSVSLKAGTTVHVTRPLPGLSPGWHRLEARLASGDQFSADDARYGALNVPVPVRTLCVETRPGEHVFQEESFFVMNALEPGLTLSNALPTRFKVDRIPLDEASATLGNRERLAQYQLVLLPGLREVPGGMGSGLADFVKQGGALVLWMGDQVSANRYNLELGALLPASLGQDKGGVLPFENGRHLGEVDFDSPVFSLFHQPESGDVSLPEFTRCLALEPSATARVLARFEDGTPFLVIRDLGEGRVALINTSADTGWTDWPKRKTFVPWLHSLCHYLTRTEGGTGIQMEKAFVANTLAHVKTSPSNAGKTFRLVAPDGMASPVTLDEQGGFSARLALPGFYSVIDTQRQLVRLMAVNLPQSESDLSALRATDFEQQIARSGPAADSGLTAPLLESGTGVSSFWRALMLSAAVLLLLEIILANRTFA
ncbi:MAG TPA: BatA domain-containing protein [Candidatus Acidoferrales bacterium]|nr:BatA domain-containing protein [Candidatus Acidoferrales bacterium]